jgi:hypothetical protein
LIHTLTVIRWPLEFGHNFMYIACTLVEAITFTQLTNPRHWYALNTVFGLMILALFVLDLRMIRRRITDSEGPTATRLYALVELEQLFNIRFLMPATVLFNLMAMMIMHVWPVFFVEEGGNPTYYLNQWRLIQIPDLAVSAFSPSTRYFSALF